MALTGTKGLMIWCQRCTEGYKDVHVKDMTKSFRDGLAFCAIIHHFRPDLINFDSLSKDNVWENNQLAFDVAEKELNIPSLLDPDDMVAMPVPDKLSIMTYVSQYYNCFKNKKGAAELGIKPAIGTGRTTVKRPMEEENPFKGKVGISPIKKAFPANTCQVCGKKVYLVEKVVSNNKLYHRSCFKCNKCGDTLRPGNAKVGVDPSQIECPHHQDKIWNLRTNMASRIKKEDKENTANILESTEGKKQESSPWVTQKTAQPPATPPSAKKPPIPTNPPSKLIHPHLSSQSSARAQFFSPSPASPAPVGEESKKSKELEKEKAKAGLITSLAGAMAKNEAKTKIQSQDGKLYNSNSKETLIDEPAESKIPKPVTPAPKVAYVKPNESKTNNNSVTSVSQRISMFSQNDTSADIKGKGPVKEERKKDDKMREGKKDVVSEQKKDDKMRAAEKISEETKADTKPIISGGGGVKAMINKMEEESSDQVSEEGGGEGGILTESEGDGIVKEEVSGLEIKKDLSEEEKQDIEQLEKEEETKKLEAEGKKKEPEVKEDDEFDENNPFFASDDEEAEEPQQELEEEKMDIDEKEGDGKKILGGYPSQENNKTGLNKIGDGKGNKEEHEKGKGSELTKANVSITVSSETETGENGDKSAMGGKHIAEKSASNEEISRTNVKKSAKAEDSDLDYDDSLNPFGSEDDEESTSDDDSDSDLGPNNPFAESDEGELDYDESLNPFGDDEDEDEAEPRENPFTGSPILRTSPSKSSKVKPPRPPPPKSTTPKKGIADAPKFKTRDEILQEMTRARNTLKQKKRRAPEAPTITPPTKGTPPSSDGGSSPSLAGTPTSRKSRRAPLPPGSTQQNGIGGSPQPNNRTPLDTPEGSPVPSPRITKSQKISRPGFKPPPQPVSRVTSKRRAPAPPPQKRDVRQHHVTPEEIQKEIAEIEVQTSELEKKGIELEDRLRAEMKDDSPEDSEELLMEWFEVVNNKNQLVRREGELVAQAQIQDLEIRHAEVEYEMRVLMHKQEHLKTDEDAKKEEELLELLVGLVQQRSTIVDRLEEDRIREQAEDETIRNMMQMKDKLLKHPDKLNKFLHPDSGLDRESIEQKKEKKKKKKKKKHKEKEKTKEKEKHKTKDKDQGDDDKEQ